VADRETLTAQRIADVHQDSAGTAHCDDVGDRGLLGRVRDELAGAAVAVSLPEAPTERTLAALVLVAAPQIALGVLDQLGDPISRRVAAEVEQPEADLAALEAFDRGQGVERRSKPSIHLAGDHDVAGARRDEQLATFRTLAQWCRAGDAGVDIEVLEAPAGFEAARLDLALLFVERDARIGLAVSADPAVAADALRAGRRVVQGSSGHLIVGPSRLGS
jgi:hypothetical protein